MDSFFFSQTGKEIVEISKKLDRWPDLIVTNERPENLRQIDKEIERGVYIILPNKPSSEDYLNLLELFDNPLITLHGWLRIIPEEICNKFEIYNGHPGLITEYPDLKGKNPQVKAYEGNYEFMGSVIHRVTGKVDEGEIHFTVKTRKPSKDELSLDDFFLKLKELSLYSWTSYLPYLLTKNDDN